VFKHNLTEVCLMLKDTFMHLAICDFNIIERRVVAFFVI